METVKVSSKGQIVIPKAMREAGRIQSGTELTISAVADGLFLAPARKIAPTKVSDGLGLLSKSGRRKMADTEEKQRIREMLKLRDEATKTR